MTVLLHEIRYDLLAQWRNPRARVFTVFLPLLLLVFLVGGASGGTTVGGDPIALKRFFVGGITGMALLVATYGATLGRVVIRREQGEFKRRRATPVTPAAVVAGQALSAIVTAAAGTVLLLVVARVAYGVGIAAEGIALMALATLVGGVVFVTLGFAVASFVPTADAAQPAIQLTMLPLYFISGLWFSVDDLPKVLRTLGQALPVEPVVDLMHRATLAPGVPARDLAVLGVWFVAGLTLAVRRFSWLPR